MKTLLSIFLLFMLNGCIGIINEDSEISKIEKSTDTRYKYQVTIESISIIILHRTNHEYKIGEKLFKCNETIK